MMSAIRRLSAAASLSLLLMLAQGQPVIEPAASTPRENKPYKVQTTGKQITIKSTKNINHVMIWTTDGNRVVEQKGINNTSVNIDLPISRKTFYLMVGLVNGRVYTEKIGIQ
jgi:hypothetical protein